ncbi:YPDG domain-containing protein [Staphylococcus pseudintermedius]|uniref:YPDG domain-containing protein n=1 Tax=Staphylococcus pseudintermedius TaxID=283734 RepID=UPI003906A772
MYHQEQHLRYHQHIPEGWTAEVDPDNGTVTVTPPADATPGTSVDIPVKVTYPDGSSENTSQGNSRYTRYW